MKRALLSAMVLLMAVPLTGSAARDPFPRPAELEPDVQFWIRVYTEVDTEGGLIHDSRHLGVVYEVVKFPDGASSRTRERIVEAAKDRYKTILQRLAAGKRSGLSADEERVLALWPDGVSNTTLRSATGQLRFQLGQADKFRAGLVRSGRWEPHIRETLRQMDVPEKLAALPHVESSYTPTAYSRVGAAGLWQFTRSTGRRYMRVDHVVDERLDPYRASMAAARLLQQNRETTGSWPLAITAYNHGAAGMRRAVRELGTLDITTIVRKYKSRTFGFASRNFYVEFLAAAEVDDHSERYFGPLLQDSPIEYETTELPWYTTASALQKALGVEMTTLRTSNPALLTPIWNGAKYVPRGYTIRVPRDELARPVDTSIASIPSSSRYANQVPDTYHTVRRGENLSSIARRYGLGVSEIVALNGLRSRHRIWAGQKLRLPAPSRGTRVASVSPTPALPVEPPPDGRYTVRRGDTISSIARQFSLDPADLARWNNLRSRHRIYVGQVLAIDSAGILSAGIDAAGTESAAIQSASIETTAVAPPPDPDPRPEAAPALSEPASDSGPATASAEASEVVSTTPGVAVPDPAMDLEGEPLQGPSLLADPSDYSVAPNGTIEVQAAETLGHYAEWLDIRASRLRQINGLRYGTALTLGRPLQLDLSLVSPEEFERRRVSYHRAIQGEFFEQFEIHGTRMHVIRRGDSLWTLSQREYNVPIWLLRQFNPDLDFAALEAGTRVTVPILRAHGGAEAAPDFPQPAASSEAGLPTSG